jgi:hypothetical protein
MMICIGYDDLMKKGVYFTVYNGIGCGIGYDRLYCAKYVCCVCNNRCSRKRLLKNVINSINRK